MHQHTFHPVSTDSAFSQLDLEKRKRIQLSPRQPFYLPPEACGLRQLASGDFVEAIVAGRAYWGVVTQRNPFTLEMLDSDGIKREVPVDCVTFGLYGFTSKESEKDRHKDLRAFLSSVTLYHEVVVAKMGTIHTIMAKQTIPWSINLEEFTDEVLKIYPARHVYAWSAAALASHIAIVNSPRFFKCDYAQTADYDSWSPLNYVALPIDTVGKLERVVQPSFAAKSIREFTVIVQRYLQSTANEQHRHLPLRALFTEKQSYETWDSVVAFLRHYVEYPHGKLRWVVPEIIEHWYKEEYEGRGTAYDTFVVRQFLQRINEATLTGTGSVFLAGPHDIAFARNRLRPDFITPAQLVELTDGNSDYYDYCSRKYMMSDKYESKASNQFLETWKNEAFLLDRHMGFEIVYDEQEPVFLHLHVPDVTQTVPVDSKVMSVVGQRSYALDTVEGRLDMLPDSIVDDLELTGDAEHRVMTVTVKLEDGTIPNHISPESVHVSFGKVQFKMMEEGPHTNRLTILLRNLLQDHYDGRIENGALPGFAQSNKSASLMYHAGEVPELPRSIFLGNSEHIDDQIAPREEKVTLLHAQDNMDVLSEARILINRLGAIYAADNNVDVLYRQQHDPLHGNKDNHPLNRKIQSLYFEKEHVSNLPGPHESLGLDAVIQIASPVDSLEDIINQHQLLCKHSRLAALKLHGREVVDLATLRSTPKNDWLSNSGKEEYTPGSERWRSIQDDMVQVLEGECPKMILELPKALKPKQLREVYTQYLRPRQRLTDRTTQLVERYWKILWMETQENFAYKCVVTRPALTYQRDPITKLSTRARAYCIDLDMEVEVEVGDMELERGDRLVSMGVERANRFTGELVLCV